MPTVATTVIESGCAVGSAEGAEVVEADREHPEAVIQHSNSKIRQFTPMVPVECGRASWSSVVVVEL
jgi:hypothetical protein